MTSRSGLLAGALILVVALLLPSAVSSYYVGLASKMLIFALFAMSLDLLVGYAGLFSLGHAAFFGVAAYTVGMLTLRAGASIWWALPAGVLAAGVTGALFGLLALRTRGSYFLMITLALAQVLWGIAFGWSSFTGGADGLPNVPRPDLGLHWSLAGTTPFYYFVLLIVAVAGAILALIVRSPFGYALRGIRDSESRMAALGYDVWRYKYLAFVLGGVFAGLAGCLYVYLNGFVGPEYVFVTRSAEALLMVILGGAGTLVGPAIGAGLITLFSNVVSAYTQRWLMILGAIYVLVTLFAPRGLMGLVHDYRRRKQQP